MRRLSDHPSRAVGKHARERDFSRPDRSTTRAGDMSASADMSSSSFGNASETRGAALEGTGPSGGSRPSALGTVVAPVRDHVRHRTPWKQLVASRPLRRLPGGHTGKWYGVAHDGGRTRRRLLRWWPRRWGTVARPGVRGWWPRWETSFARARSRPPWPAMFRVPILL